MPGAAPRRSAALAPGGVARGADRRVRRRQMAPRLPPPSGMTHISETLAGAATARPDRLPADGFVPLAPADDTLVHLPEVGRHVLDLVFAAPAATPPSHRGLVWAAVRYGMARMQLGIGTDGVRDELELLRLASANRIERSISEPAQREQLLATLAQVMDLAHECAMLGRERESLQARGRWDAELQRALRASPFEALPG